MSETTTPPAAIEPQPVQPDEKKAKGDGPLMIAVGASAGGLEAFFEMLDTLPADPGFVLIFVQHREAGHAGLLADLLSRRSAMPVAEVHEAVAAKINHIYIAPADAALQVRDGTLIPVNFKTDIERHGAIDALFTAVAEDQRENAIAVILSGTATDGVGGMKEIREKGGITFVQDARTARFDGLPLAAVQAGVADYILPPAAIALELLRIAGAYPKILRRRSDLELTPAEREILNKILVLVWKASGVDFSCYKSTTVKRRILRRVVLTKLIGIEEYYRYIEKNPGEVQALYETGFVQYIARRNSAEIIRKKIHSFADTYLGARLFNG